MHYNSTNISDRYQESVPEHECTPDECEVTGGFMMSILDADDSIIVNSTAHNMNPASIVQAFVQVIDESFVRNRPDGMPVSVAIAQSREFIRQGADRIDPPGDFSASLSDFLESMERLLGDSNE